MLYKKVMLGILVVVLDLVIPTITLGDDSTDFSSGTQDDANVTIQGGYRVDNTPEIMTVYIGAILPENFTFPARGCLIRYIPSSGNGFGGDAALVASKTGDIYGPMGIQYYLGCPVMKFYGGVDVVLGSGKVEQCGLVQCYFRVGLQGEIGPVGCFIQSRLCIPRDEYSSPFWGSDEAYETKMEAGLVIRLFNFQE